MVQTLNNTGKAPPLPIKKAGESPYLRMVLYGNSGIGKTRFMATLEDCAEAYPAIILDIEKGTGSLAGTDLDIVEVDTTKSLNDMYEYLKNDTYYKTVVIDSLSQVHANLLLDLIKENNDSGRRQSYQKDALELQDYNKALNQLTAIIRNFKTLKKHLILTCLAREEANPKEGTVRMPELAGKLANTIGQYVDAVIYLTKDSEGNRLAVTQETKITRAKFRVGKDKDKSTPASVINPTMAKLLAIKNGTYKA